MASLQYWEQYLGVNKKTPTKHDWKSKIVHFLTFGVYLKYLLLNG